MSKPVALDIDQFKATRKHLVDKLQVLYSTVRQMEEALGLPTQLAQPLATASKLRVRALPPAASAARIDRAPKATTSKPPVGGIQLRVWTYLRDHGGTTAAALAAALKLDMIPTTTALYSMKRDGRLTVKGSRGHYRYFVISKITH